MLLIKGRENVLYENKNKLNENETKKTNANKDIEKYNQYYKNYNIKQLDNINIKCNSFSYYYCKLINYFYIHNIKGIV